jgi:hypothetical protein
VMGLWFRIMVVSSSSVDVDFDVASDMF